MNICPACGYPMYGPGLCPFCLPIQAITDDLTFQPVFSAVNSPSALPSPPGGMRDCSSTCHTQALTTHAIATPPLSPREWYRQRKLAKEDANG